MPPLIVEITFGPKRLDFRDVYLFCGDKKGVLAFFEVGGAGVSWIFRCQQEEWLASAVQESVFRYASMYDTYLPMFYFTPKNLKKKIRLMMQLLDGFICFFFVLITMVSQLQSGRSMYKGPDKTIHRS
jgi:hypothetical protein